jgi:hypothetical protein
MEFPSGGKSVSLKRHHITNKSPASAGKRTDAAAEAAIHMGPILMAASVDRR